MKGVQDRVAALRPNPAVAIGQSFVPFVIAIALAFVGALLLAGLLWMALRQYRRWQAQRYRRDALSALQALEPALADPARRVVALRQMAELVKRTQLSETERQAVASLSGVVWLKALDKGWPRHGFTTPPLNVLADLSSATDETLSSMPAGQVTALVAALRRWVGASHA